MCTQDYRALAITSRKHKTKHFHMAKKYCAQWQLDGSRCLTHNLSAYIHWIYTVQYCTIATVNLKFQACLVSEFTVQPITLLPYRHGRWRRKCRDLQLIYGCDVNCKHSIGWNPLSPHCKSSQQLHITCDTFLANRVLSNWLSGSACETSEAPVIIFWW